MNAIISDLIKELEESRHPVATKEYVLKRLRESQWQECEFCEQLPNVKSRTWRRTLHNVKGGG